MENLNIGTWHLKNKFFDIETNKLKVNAIIDLLENGKLSILGLQNVNYLLAIELDERLQQKHSNYHITSFYSENINPFLTHNLTISNLSIYEKEEQHKLFSSPDGFDYYKSFFNIKKYELTSQSFKISQDNLVFNNVYLKDTYDYLTTRYLMEIYCKLVKDNQILDNIESILVGSFGKFSDNTNFKNLMNKFGFYVIKNVNTKNGINNLNYIAVPKFYLVESVDLIENYSEEISDYNPIIMKVKRK